MPCRLFVIPARTAPVAVILRRGPSRWSQVIAWDTHRDVFTEGAWLKGRIYEDRCDLSPDGALLLYFCHGGRSRPGYTDSWTAVSRLPWLHALALWPWGTTYGGGGRFVGDREVVLRIAMPVATHPEHPADELRVTTLKRGESLDVHRSTGMPDTDWSGVDHDGRVVFCRGGKVFRRSRDGSDMELADFAERKPAPAEAPEWARGGAGDGWSRRSGAVVAPPTDTRSPSIRRSSHSCRGSRSVPRCNRFRSSCR
jgi:hypothetical protein